MKDFSKMDRLQLFSEWSKAKKDKRYDDLKVINTLLDELDKNTKTIDITPLFKGVLNKINNYNKED